MMSAQITSLSLPTLSIPDESRKVVVLFTDPGEEIDDEILIHLLLKNEQIEHDVYIVCVPGKSDKTYTRSISQVMHERVQRVRDVFPEMFGTSNEFKSSSSPNASRFTVWMMDEFYLAILNYENKQNKPFHINTLLQIAPLWHMPIDLMEKLQIDLRIVQGDLDNPEQSINLTKAMPKDNMQLRKAYLLQDTQFNKVSTKTVCVPTSFARQVPTPYALIAKLPVTMQQPLLDTAFAQFVGRPDPSLPWAESISFANHATILKMLPPDVMYNIFMDKPHSLESGEDIKTQVYHFLEEYRHQLGEESTQYTQYSKRLEQIAKAVLHITKVPYDGKGFSEDTLLDKVSAKQYWLDHIHRHKCNQSPLYDGLTWVVMKEGELPNVERCKEIIQEMVTSWED